MLRTLCSFRLLRSTTPLAQLATTTTAPLRAFGSAAASATSEVARNKAAGEDAEKLGRGRRLYGKVIDSKLPKTAKVQVTTFSRAKKTRARIKKNKNFLVHDPLDQCFAGDTVSIRQCAKISTQKYFELEDIVHRRKASKYYEEELKKSRRT